MKKFLKNNWKFLLLVLFGGLIGGYCFGLYNYDCVSPELTKQLQEQNVSKEMLGLVTMIQYGISFGLILASLLFALGHLPATAIMTSLTPLIIFRCFLFNVVIGLLFGYLYRKYNIRYAIVSHGLCHLIADILMLIFI